MAAAVGLQAFVSACMHACARTHTYTYSSLYLPLPPALPFVFAQLELNKRFLQVVFQDLKML
jgi:hypothetical protein